MQIQKEHTAPWIVISTWSGITMAMKQCASVSNENGKVVRTQNGLAFNAAGDAVGWYSAVHWLARTLRRGNFFMNFP